MKKILLVMISILVSAVHTVWGDSDNGPHFTKPIPPFCSMKVTEKKCVATACAMLLRYWAEPEVKVLEQKSCKKYAEIVTEALKNEWDKWAKENPDKWADMSEEQKKSIEKGGSPLNTDVIGKALKTVASNNLIDKENITVSTQPLRGILYTLIKRRMTYSKLNDLLSPWDRPALLLAGERCFNDIKDTGHAAVAYGCKTLDGVRSCIAAFNLIIIKRR